MAQNYQQYGGNPYGQEEAGFGSNPYSGTGSHGVPNPYGGTNEQQLNAPPPLTHEESNYSQTSQYSQPTPYASHQPTAPLNQQDFLARVDGTKTRINQLSSSIQEIATIHQRILTSPDTGASAQLEGVISQTQVRNTQIKDEIKYLERDAARDPNNSIKKTQVASLKDTFKLRLTEFRQEENDYSRRYRDAISRQYLIVNPRATEEEANEAANADWGNEGVFQQALKTNRSGQAASVLGVVRVRHNDIQRIEKTVGELNALFQQLDEVVFAQEDAVTHIEHETSVVIDENDKANKELDEGLRIAYRTRRLKWWTLLTVVAIICILALVLGLYFGLKKNGNDNNK